MKRNWLILAVVLGVFLFVRPTSAALVTSIDMVDALNNPVPTPNMSLWDLQPTGITNLNTPITIENVGMNVLRRGSAIYYTTDAGIVKQGLGQSVTRVLRDGSGLVYVAGQGTKMLINNTTYNRPFIFDIYTKKAKSLKPRMKAAESADVANGGKVVAILARNMRDKQKLFLSQGDPSTYREIALPKDATKCDSVVISPNATKLAMICEWMNDDASGKSVFTALINGQTISSFRRKSLGEQISPWKLGWVSDARLVVLATDPPTSEVLFSYSIYQLTVDRRGKAMNQEQLVSGITGQSILNDTASIIPLAMHIQRHGRAGFYFSLYYIGGDEVDEAVSYWGTAIGYVDLLQNTWQWAVNDQMFNVLAERPNYIVTPPIL